MKRGVAIELQSSCNRLLSVSLLSWDAKTLSLPQLPESIGFTPRIHCLSTTLRNADFLGPTRDGQRKGNSKFIFCILVDIYATSAFSPRILKLFCL